MKIYYLMNEHKEIIEDGYTKFNEGCLEMPAENYHIKNGFNGALFFVDYMETEEYKARELEYKKRQEFYELRYRRETECFPIINRGELWYKTLTEQQLHELNAWYQAWLNVTETKVVPKTPSWIK